MLFDSDLINLSQDAKWQIVRQRRDALLAASDWTQLDDAPLSSTMKASWKLYRKALRDATLVETPDAVVFPDAPS